ncbi:hypothetical protein BJ973_007120 [Actinoplanes tereljensis]|nr:hypothetical protein [Actinoplanes tereljensis]
MNLQSIAARRFAAVALTMVSTAGLAVQASPAMAASHRPCAVEKHFNLAGVEKVGTATATIGADGVKLTTSRTVDTDKVSWKSKFLLPVPADSVNEMNYETVKLDSYVDDTNQTVNNAALPSYHIYVRTRAGAEATLIYEPYYNLPANPQRNVRTEWDVTTGKLWTSATTLTGVTGIGGGSYATNKTLAQIIATNPGLAVTGIGWGLGTYNRGVVAIMDDQRFATKLTCTDHQWSTGFSTGIFWPGWLF